MPTVWHVDAHLHTDIKRTWTACDSLSDTIGLTSTSRTYRDVCIHEGPNIVVRQLERPATLCGVLLCRHQHDNLQNLEIWLPKSSPHVAARQQCERPAVHRDVLRRHQRHYKAS